MEHLVPKTSTVLKELKRKTAENLREKIDRRKEKERVAKRGEKGCREEREMKEKKKSENEGKIERDGGEIEWFCVEWSFWIPLHPLSDPAAQWR